MICGQSIMSLEPMHSRSAVTEHSVCAGQNQKLDPENPGSSLVVWIHQSHEDGIWTRADVNASSTSNFAQRSWLFPLTRKTIASGRQSFWFAETLDVLSRGTLRVKGNKTHGFPWGQQVPYGPVTKCFIIPPNPKLEQRANKLFAWHWVAHKSAVASRCPWGQP